MSQNNHYSDITKKQKKRFSLFLGIYLFGFFILSLIGNSINTNGYVLTALFAPLTILIGAVGITWNFYSGTDRSE